MTQSVRTPAKQQVRSDIHRQIVQKRLQIHRLVVLWQQSEQSLRVPLQQTRIRYELLLETRPQHLSRMFPFHALVDEDTVSEKARHFPDTVLADTPIAKVRR